MTEDLFLASHGGGCVIGISIYLQSHISRRDEVENELYRVINPLCETNHRLRQEYRAKVESGEIVPSTISEQLIAAANGHEDNEATHAARRCCIKRGLKWK